MTAIIFGGSGFVGAHLVRLLIAEGVYQQVIIADLEPPNIASDTSNPKFIHCDVRKEIDADAFTSYLNPDEIHIYNLAAICRIPGFPRIDYFRTNITGAEHICRFAEEIDCHSIVFTSTIAVYGLGEELKSEESVPQPDNPYGSSKLVAEYIHRGWQKQNRTTRNLAILRPGIIFGQNEQANFTRLYQSLQKGVFLYPGRRDTRKACVYVKDMARACLHFSGLQCGIHLYNFVLEESPSIEEICETIARITGVKKPRLTIPSWLLVTAAYGIKHAGGLTGKSYMGIHPDRVKKLMDSTNISGKKLTGSGFSLKYSLSAGIRDWYEDSGHSGLM